MYNNKKNMRITVLFWIVILVCTLLTIAAVNANAADPNHEDKITSEKFQAVVILWYTADGEPHNIFIVDAAHVSLIAHNNVVIDRNPRGAGVDQVIIGGLIDMQYFGYDQVFNDDGTLREKFRSFAWGFKEKAGEHLKLGKDDDRQ